LLTIVVPVDRGTGGDLPRPLLIPAQVAMLHGCLRSLGNLDRLQRVPVDPATPERRAGVNAGHHYPRLAMPADVAAVKDHLALDFHTVPRAVVGATVPDRGASA